MHEKGNFYTVNNVIFNKINNKIKIRELSIIVSVSQNLILKIGDICSGDLLKYYHEYIKTLSKNNEKEYADDIQIITIKRKEMLSQDDICTLINYALSTSNIKILDWLKEPELKLTSKTQKLQYYGW